MGERGGLIQMHAFVGKFSRVTYAPCFVGATLKVCPTIRQSQTTSVFHVLRPRYIFKVGVVIIRLLSVFMVDLAVLRSRAEKRQSNQRMDLKVFWATIAAKFNRQVSKPACVGSHENRAAPWSVGVELASHRAKLRDAVFTFIPDDGFPYLVLECLRSKFLRRHGMNLTDRFVSSLGSFAVQPAFGPLLF